MKCKTYKLVLPKAESAISIVRLEKIINLIKKFPKKDYFITIEPVSLDDSIHKCKFTISIIILKRSLEEAIPICDKITKLLEKNGEIATKVETFLIWDEPTEHFYCDLKD